MGMWRQLPTATAYSTALDHLPTLFRHATGLKVVLDGAGQVNAREGAVIACSGQRIQSNEP